ncbi:MAG: hypothetical protein P1U89_15575 [Verrucomicrobiales bacterium]|nr:hypothetical protein [Verrucomicrobiales bacterium]
MHTKKTAQEIAILKGGFVLMPETKPASSEGASSLNGAVASFQAEVMQLGYLFNNQLCGALNRLSPGEVGVFYSLVIPILRTLKGADRVWKPLYPNFPAQVMEAEPAELFCKAIMHYWSFGQWRPEYQKQDRIPVFEDTKFITLGLGSTPKFMAIFTDLLGSNASLNPFDHDIIRWFVKFFGEDLEGHLPERIPFKEQAASFVAACMENDVSLGDRWGSTPTDVLRVATAISNGDISLAKNTRFKSPGRPVRKRFCEMLEKVINADDIARHGEKWKRLFHSLHIGDYQRVAPRSYRIADQLRNGKIITFRSKVEQAIVKKDYAGAIDLLVTRPGELARRLDHLLRLGDESEGRDLIDRFSECLGAVDNRLLIQLLGHFRNREKGRSQRLVFPKGRVAKAKMLTGEVGAIPATLVERVVNRLESHLTERFSVRGSLGNVWIDPRLKYCPVPLSQRSASPGLVSVARGTRLPLGEKSTLRLFVWWIGMDIDLSAVFYSDSMEKLFHLSYTNLRLDSIGSCHSGDIVRAPKPDGAAEFVDIDIEKALGAGCRYVLMSVFDFSRLSFAQHEDCCAGWMTRDYPDANEVFDPKSVEQKIDIRTASYSAVPVVFDLRDRVAIWMDLDVNAASRRPSNVESNAASLAQIVESTMMLENKPTLHDLFSLHAAGRGTIVDTREEADSIFSLYEGVTPFHIDKILSDYLV